MAATTHQAYTAAAASALTTALDALANATASAASSAIDNTSTLDLYADWELVLGTQSSRTAGCAVALYITPSLDGTNYSDVSSSSAELLGVFTLATGTGAQRVIIRDTPIPPALFKVFVVNNSTQAFAASSNTVKYRTHSIKTV
jgi:hypothetical protein